MSQQEIYQVLKQNKTKWLGSEDIWKLLNKRITRACICTNLKKLRERNEVHHKNKWNGTNTASIVHKYKKK